MTEIDPALLPLGATPAWLATTAAAEYRCECTGACGTGHRKSAGRCDKALAKHTGVRLYATPAKPGAATLIAVCGDCLDKRERIERKAATDAAHALADLAPSLYDLLAEPALT